MCATCTGGAHGGVARAAGAAAGQRRAARARPGGQRDRGRTAAGAAGRHAAAHAVVHAADARGAQPLVDCISLFFPFNLRIFFSPIECTHSLLCQQHSHVQESQPQFS
jgi:hypothetical protein